GSAGHWVERRQAEVREVHLRALELISEAAAAMGEWSEAVAAAEQAIVLEPFREPAHLRLMAAHAGAGNRAAALRAYQRCRAVLADQLGADPSPATQAAHRALLGPHTPPLVAAAGGDRRPAGRLPLDLTSFVGRSAEVAALARLLGSRRLVTLTGPGGVGKSRLAVETARSARADAGGVFLVELAGLADDDLVAQQFLTALGVGEVMGLGPHDTLVARLGDREALLIADSCERVIEGCASVVDLLVRRCAGVRVLATSREPLRVPGEAVWSVPPLETPDPARVTSLDEALGYGAVQLFVERARAIKPGFQPSAGEVAAVVQLCRRLDGIPLALELAAARTDVLSVEEIAARLDDRFRLLAQGARTAPARHQTLRAAIDWTHDALAPSERRWFSRLAAFPGGFTLGAAERLAVVGDDDMLAIVAQLVAKSLVVADRGPGPTRYGMLESVRQYGEERLDQSGEAVPVRDALAQWALELAERAEAELAGPHQREWLDRLEVEHDNLRAALAWVTGEAARPDGESGARLAAALGRFW
ncbi:MAG: ATP-binding protein, partial [Acidimicrobiales bacterium]